MYDLVDVNTIKFLVKSFFPYLLLLCCDPILYQNQFTYLLV